MSITHTAGFAVNLDLLVSKPTAYIDPRALRGDLESSLLKHLVTVDQLEGKPPDCNKVGGVCASVCVGGGGGGD